MTKKRDLKRLVRERQAKTGESYVTARRNVLRRTSASARAGADAPKARISVVEMIDLTPDAWRLGLRCRVKMASTLTEQGNPSVILERIRDALNATADDPATRRLRATVLRGEAPERDAKSANWWATTRRFVSRTLAGLSGISETGDMMALQINTAHASVLAVAYIGGQLQLGPTGAVQRAPERPGEQPLLVLTTVDAVSTGPDQLITLLMR